MLFTSLYTRLCESAIYILWIYIQTESFNLARRAGAFVCLCDVYPCCYSTQRHDPPLSSATRPDCTLLENVQTHSSCWPSTTTTRARTQLGIQTLLLFMYIRIYALLCGRAARSIRQAASTASHRIKITPSNTFHLYIIYFHARYCVYTMRGFHLPWTNILDNQFDTVK